MIGAFNLLADEGIDSVIVTGILARCPFGADIGGEGGLGEDFPREADAGAELQPIVGMGHIVEADTRQAGGVGIAQADPAAALRALGADMNLKAVARGERFAVIGNSERQEMILDIGVDNAGAAADMAAAFEMVGRAEAVAGEEPLQTNLRLAPEALRGEQGDGLAAGHLHVEFEMIHQVLADAGGIVQDGDAVFPQLRCGADARAFEDDGRHDGTGRKDDIAPGLGMEGFASDCIGDPRGAGAFEQDAVHGCAGDDADIAARHCGAQIGAGSAHAAALPDIHLHRAEALMLALVHIGAAGITGLNTRFDKGLIKRVPLGAAFDFDGAILATQGAAALDRLKPPEIGQHIRPAPALGAERLP